MKKNMEVKWNFEPYMSDMVVSYPKPPEGILKPMALCDLVARRAQSAVHLLPGAESGDDARSRAL